MLFTTFYSQKSAKRCKIGNTKKRYRTIQVMSCHKMRQSMSQKRGAKLCRIRRDKPATHIVLLLIYSTHMIQTQYGWHHARLNYSTVRQRRLILYSLAERKIVWAVSPSLLSPSSLCMSARQRVCVHLAVLF